MASPTDPSRRQISVVTRGLIRLVERLTGLPRWRAYALTIVCFWATVTIDFVALGSFNPHFYFMATIFVAAWALDERAGLLCAIAAAACVTLVNGAGYGLTAHNPHIVAILLNCLGRLGMFSALAFLSSALRSLMDREHQRATIDDLTGALNAMALRERIGPLVAHTRRTGGAIVLGYADLDGFKCVNDRHGHAEGDAVLRAFADGAREAIRPYDLLARVGGDEFVVVQSVRDAEEGYRVAEMLHLRLTRVLEDTGHAVTCSMGALLVPASGIADWSALIGATDALMYEVKRGGKNALRLARTDKLGAVAAEARPSMHDGGLAALSNAANATETEMAA